MLTADQARSLTQPVQNNVSDPMLKLHLDYIQEMIKVAASNGDLSCEYRNQIFYVKNSPKCSTNSIPTSLCNTICQTLEDAGYNVTKFAGDHALNINWYIRKN